MLVSIIIIKLIININIVILLFFCST